MRVLLRPKTVAAYVAVTLVAAALGLWLGRPNATVPVRPPAAAPTPPDSATVQKWREWHDSLAQEFRRAVVGIEPEKPFPNLVLSRFDSDSLLTIAQALPAGGIIALVTADCDKCVQTASALQAALDSTGIKALPVMLLADELDGAMSFAAELARKGVRLPLFCDRERALRGKHNVQGTMPWFRLDATLRLVSYGFVFEPDTATLRCLVSEESIPGRIREHLQMRISQERR